MHRVKYIDKNERKQYLVEYNAYDTIHKSKEPQRREKITPLMLADGWLGCRAAYAF